MQAEAELAGGVGSASPRSCRRPATRPRSATAPSSARSPGPITSGFGYRTDPVTGATAYHAGIDFGAPCGTPIKAAGTGQVLSAGFNSGGYGNMTADQPRQRAVDPLRPPVVDHRLGRASR